MDLSKWKKKTGELLLQPKEVLFNLWSRLLSLSPPSFPKDPINKLLERFPREKRKILLIGAGGMTALLLVLLIALAAGRPKGATKTRAEARLSIAPEEFFYPEEPDFLPEFLLERESRRFWSIEDIRQYWKVPGDSQWWREEIKSIMDKLMESVP
jgi:hypothetical protein